VRVSETWSKLIGVMTPYLYHKVGSFMRAIKNLGELENLLSLKQVAEMLGVSISTLYKRTGDKAPKDIKLETFNVFGKLYVHPDDLVDYINKHAM